MAGFRSFASGFLAALALGIAVAQTAPPQPAAPAAPAQVASNPNAPETVTKEQPAPATFRTAVNLVMVPVVVRDKRGKAVGGLQKEDFQLFDKSKPQVVSRFTVEKSGIPMKPGTPKPPEEGMKVPITSIPERFVAYLFDDLYTEPGDLMRVRDAAGRHMDKLAITDRAALFTTSGMISVDFTDSRDQLHDALRRLMPRGFERRVPGDCPDLGFLQAQQIYERDDTTALGAATNETMVCMNMSANERQAAESVARSMARKRYFGAQEQSRRAMMTIRDVLRRMSGMPGQRTIILASPGFLGPDIRQDETDLLDRAVRYNVIISSIDARGLYTDPQFDASRSGAAIAMQGVWIVKSQYERDEVRNSADVLAELALGTGGTFIQNTNDFDGGFERVASAPEYIYILGFAPQNLKLDGSYHALKVSLKDPGGLSLQARRGYYAPKRLNDPEENAKEEIREALFSREEVHELPVDLHTQFFKSSEENARVTVVMHIDLKNLRFRKAEGRNKNDLTITAGLFDRNGNYVVGNQKLLEMRLKDETIEKRADTGFSVRSSFDVKPGTYLVRLVVRDAEGQQMSAANGAVEIP